jgi:lipopolysaccharide export system protein LptA
VNRKTGARLVLAFGAAFLLVLAISFRPGKRASKESDAGTLPTAPAGAEATTLLSGFEFSESVGGKPAFSIRAERTVGFGTGAGLAPDIFSGERVALTIYPDSGEPVTVLADKGNYDQRTKAASLSGNVRWTDGSGALGETARLNFDPGKRVLTAPEPLRLTRGGFVLHAKTGRYEVAMRRAVLDGPIQGEGTGEGSGGVTSLSARDATYRRDESVVELSGDVRVERGKAEWLEADRVLLKMAQEGGRLEWARASGKARGRTAEQPASAGAAASAARSWSAEDAAVTFDASGEASRLDLTGSPARLEENARKLAASTIQIDFAGARPSFARATGKVRMDAGSDSVTSSDASVSFAPDGTVMTSEASGGVRMQGEGRAATADRAVELPGRGAVVLTGEAGRLATVSQEGSALSAPRLEIDRGRRTIAGRGGAQARFLPRKGAPASGAGLIGDPKKPVHGKAETIVLEEESRVASLSGGASLWQEESSISANNITINDRERTLVAVGGARAVLPVSSSGSATRTAPGATPAPPVRTVASASRIAWSESANEIRLEESVSVERGTQRATAKRGLAEIGADRRLDRVELEGDVHLTDPAAGRTARGQKAIDYPREGKTVLEGSPATAEDAQGNKVAGATLTITERGRRVEVTAPAGGTTETVHKTRRD